MVFSSASSLVQIRIRLPVVSPSVVLEPFPLVAKPLLAHLDRARLTPMAPSLMGSSSRRLPPTLMPPVAVLRPLRPSLLQSLLQSLLPPQHPPLLRHLDLDLDPPVLPKDSLFRMARTHKLSTRSSQASPLVHPAPVSYPPHSSPHEARTQLASLPFSWRERLCRRWFRPMRWRQIRHHRLQCHSGLRCPPPRQFTRNLDHLHHLRRGACAHPGDRCHGWTHRLS